MPFTSRLSSWSLFALAVMLIGAPAAQAQTVIELLDTSQSPNPCIFTTNAGGVVADPTTGHLRATGSFGENCQTAPSPTPTISPRLEDWAIPASWAIGIPAQVEWAAANADRCVYDGSSIPSGQASSWPWPSSGVACSSTSTCGSLHTLTLNPAVAGDYHFKLTCTYGGNAQTAAISEISRTVTAAPTGCVAPEGWTRVTQTRLAYPQGASIGNSPTTKFEHVWGQRSSAPGVFHPWPYIQGNNVGPQFGARQYVALEFTPTVGGAYALYANSTSFPFPNQSPPNDGLSVTISRNCGDFTSLPGPDSPTPSNCWFNNLGGAGGIFYSVGAGHSCQLQMGQTYYLNMVWTSLPVTSSSTSRCPGGTCAMQYQNSCPPPGTQCTVQ